MCGIFAIFGLPEPGVNWREEGLRKNSKCSLCKIDRYFLYESYGPYEFKMAYLNSKRCSKMIRHRGPDWNGIHCDKNCVIAHERLAIVGVNTGAQAGFRTFAFRSLLDWLVNATIWLFEPLKTILSQFVTSNQRCSCLSMEKSTTIYQSKNNSLLKTLNMKMNLFPIQIVNQSCISIRNMG